MRLPFADTGDIRAKALEKNKSRPAEIPGFPSGLRTLRSGLDWGTVAGMAKSWTIRRSLRWVAGGTLALLLLNLAAWRISDARCFTLVGSTTCRVETRAPMVALSFDDGPTAAGVGEAIAALRRNGAHATFFVIGNEVEARPALVGALLAEGHEVGNHSFSHPRMVGRPASFYDGEIARTDAVLRRAGARPRLFRPPYGKKLVGLPRAVARNGYRMITWDVEDPPNATNARDYADRLLRDVRPGSIILMHIMYPPNRVAREALPLVLDGLRERGLQVVTVGRLLEEAER